MRATGQIGAILLRKTEKVRQGWRVEFVAGQRAVRVARQDHTTLAETAGLLSSHTRDVPGQVRKLQEESRQARKHTEELLGQIAELQAAQLLGDTPQTGGRRRLVVRVFPNRDVNFIKLLAQTLVRLNASVVALLAATAGESSLVFAQSAGQPFDMGALMKESVAKLGGRGGGSKDMAQGGITKTEGLDEVLEDLSSRLRS